LRAAAHDAIRFFRCFDLVGSSAFWHGLLGVDAKLRPITPIYTWADSRCMPDATPLRKEFSEADILQRTGCMLRFCFWPAKLRWLRRTDHRLFSRVRFWVSPCDWILQSLFGELATSESMASATGLFNLTSRGWDAELCDVTKIDKSQLPPIRCSLGNDTRVLTAIGDGAASNIGSGAISENIAAINLGTSAAVRVITRRPLRIPHGLFRYIANEKNFVIGGAISNAGNLHGWCQRQLRLPRSAQIDRKPLLSDSFVALPFFIAERAPDWPEFSAAMLGFKFTSAPLQIFGTLITAALYRLADVFDILEQAIGRIDRIIVSGGMTKSRAIVEILADALGRAVELSTDKEASLRGAALHALNKEEVSAAKKASIIPCNKKFAEQHRARRETQHYLAKSLQNDGAWLKTSGRSSSQR
jgi:gluconokinase